MLIIQIHCFLFLRYLQTPAEWQEVRTDPQPPGHTCHAGAHPTYCEPRPQSRTGDSQHSQIAKINPLLKCENYEHISYLWLIVFRKLVYLELVIDLLLASCCWFGIHPHPMFLIMCAKNGLSYWTSFDVCHIYIGYRCVMLSRPYTVFQTHFQLLIQLIGISI